MAVPVEFQILGEEALVTHVMSRYETPWALNVRRLHLLWWAPTLPSCGYAAFDLAIGTTDAAAGGGRRLVSGGEKFAENERIKMSINHDGTFEISDKASGVTYHRVAAIEDVGDVGDEYNYSPPASDRRIASADARVIATSRIGGGPLRAGLRVELELPVPRSASSDRKSRTAESVMLPVTIEATLDAGSPRVAFAVSVDNRAADHRLRLLFPTGAAAVSGTRGPTPRSMSSPARHANPGARHGPQRVAGQQHADDLGGRRGRRRDRRDRDRQGLDGIRDRYDVRSRNPLNTQNKSGLALRFLRVLRWSSGPRSRSR